MAVYCLIETHGKISYKSEGFIVFCCLFFLLLIFQTVIMDLVKFVCF